MAICERTPLENEDIKSWYIGIENGFPFDTSFGTDKARFGWNIIPYVGYRLNSILSLEGQALWGKVHLSSCEEQSHYLFSKWNNNDLQSNVFIQQYTTRLNIDLLKFLTNLF